MSAAAPDRPEPFTVALDGFSGPLELLLELARRQKVDLARISVLALAEQYLAYLGEARRLRLEIAADYLVMAAWLAYLKSQLLLPAEARDDPEAEQAAADLADRLRLLEAVRRTAADLARRPLLGRDRLPRGAPEELPVIRDGSAAVTLADLLRAWGALAARTGPVVMRLPPRRLVSVEQVFERLARQLTGRDWRSLESFLPPEWQDGLVRRSAVASSLVAGLELARRGEVELRQLEPFGPVYVRRRT